MAFRYREGAGSLTVHKVVFICHVRQRIGTVCNNVIYGFLTVFQMLAVIKNNGTSIEVHHRNRRLFHDILIRSSPFGNIKEQYLL